SGGPSIWGGSTSAISGRALLFRHKSVALPTELPGRHWYARDHPEGHQGSGNGRRNPAECVARRTKTTGPAFPRVLFVSGGGGNRTRVPWHFSADFYVCSSSMPEGRRLAAPPSRSPGHPPTSRVAATL